MGERMRKRFTLLEMVVAMLIVGVLLSLSLTGLEKLATAEAMQTAATRLENAALKARSKAIIEGREQDTYVALLLPDSNEFINVGGLPCRSYRICTVKKKDTGSSISYEFKGWIKNEDWQTLGTGIVIVGASDAQRENRAVDADIDENNSYKVENESTGKKLSGVSVLRGTKFYDYKDGEYGEEVSSSDISAVDDIGYITGVPGAPANGCPGIVFNKYGNIVNAVNLCLVLAEGNVLESKYSNSENVYRFRNVFTDTKNGDLYLGNWVEITFNIFTGRPNIRMMGEDQP